MDLTIRILLLVGVGLLLTPQHTLSIEMHFEPKDGGFFIRSPASQSGSSTATSSASASAELSATDLLLESDSPAFGLDRGDPALLNTEHFTVLPSSQPVSIRVMYGPFSTKQTVPVRLLVPDPLDSLSINGTFEPEMIPPLDLSAHIVTPTVPKDTPILRVLFHAGQTAFGLPIPAQVQSQRGSRLQGGSGGSRRSRTRLCLVAQATKATGDVVTSSCSPDARDSTCLAELTLPIHWWPELPYEDLSSSSSQSLPPVKPTKVHIQVSYTVYEPENGHCNEIGLSTLYGSGIIGEGSGKKRIQIQPPTPLSSVLLVDAQKSYRVVKADASDAVKLLVPQGSLYPHAKFYVPVLVGKHDHQSIVAFIMRARVKSGLRIIGIEPNVDKLWNITTDFNPRRTHATITAVRKFNPKFQQHKSNHGDGEEVFNWILEAAEEAGDDWDGGRVVWILRYVIQPPTQDTSWMDKDPFANFGDERHKLTTRLEIQKDDIQAVLPIAKSWEVVNTAVLNGKQMSRPMKIFIVSRAGQVADVTLQASCRSFDESVLKVSSSCTSVYVDGSEIRGSTNATIGIKYGTYEGSAQFTVWMPEFPLDIQVSDSKLNQIKGWRVPNGLRESQGKREVSSFTKMIDIQGDDPSSAILGEAILPTKNVPKLSSTDMSSYYGPSTAGLGEEDLEDPWDDHHETGGQVEDHREDNDHHNEDVDGNAGVGDGDDSNYEDKFHCRPRYQHSRIDVYGRFLAQDHDSGRTSYFISRKTYLKITDLVSDYLRVSDSQVAVIKGAQASAIQGVGPGRTELQVVSPVTGRVLGTKEIRVLNERVTISSMKVQVISGVQLSLFPDTDSDNLFVAETAITSKLSAKYQEALLDIKLSFSDNTWIQLDEIDRDNYVLAVDSLEPSVVELPPIQNSKYPRIIAVSEGGGPIMRVSLELSDQCHRQNSSPLGMSMAQVEVNFTATSTRSEFTQNDSNQGLGVSKHGIRKSSGGRGSKSDRKKELLSGSGFSSGHHSHSNGGHSNLHDMTGIPLKDDSSKASLPSQHFGPITVGFIPDKGWNFAAHNTPLEIAMYVLLGVFSVAILVFVTSCFVYASRVKKRDNSHPDELLGFKMDQHHLASLGGGAFGLGGRTSGNAGGVGGSTNAHDWVWLGRASLALHPSLDSAKHPAFSSSSQQQVNKSVCYDPSNPPAGLNPIRIITNPNFDSVQPQQGCSQQASAGSSSSSPPSQSGSSSRPLSKTQQGIGPEAVTARVAPPPRPPKPSSSIDSSTFSVKSPSGIGGGVTSPQGSIFSGGEDCPDYRPPVPPHRNISQSNQHHHQQELGSASTKPTSSTNPFHHQYHHPSSSSNSYNHNSSPSSSSSSSAAPKTSGCGKASKIRKDPSDDLPNPCYVDYADQQQNQKAKRLQELRSGAAPANIMGNPMTYIDEESEDDEDDMGLQVAAASAVANRQSHSKMKMAAAAAAASKASSSTKQNNLNSSSVKLDMDYDQLMEYFDNLKETEA